MRLFYSVKISMFYCCKDLKSFKENLYEKNIGEKHKY